MAAQSPFAEQEKAAGAVFTERFGAERLRGGDELTTVATGLALRARAAA
jgi:hypothetical protein